MSFYNNLVGYKKSVKLNNKPFMVAPIISNNIFKKLNIVIQLARRPEELYKRTFSYSSLEEENGSLTIESALVIPIFMFFVSVILYFFIMLSVDMEIYRSMNNTFRDIEYAKVLLAPESGVEGRDLIIKTGIAANLSEEMKNNDLVKKTTKGLDVSESDYDKDTGILNMVVDYKYSLPFVFGDVGVIRRKQKLKCKLFVGECIEKDEVEDPYVYVTKTGTVYHTNINCSYLKLGIKEVAFAEIEDIRNKWGAIYYPCDKCYKEECENVYVTEDGNRYHASLLCSTLTRDVQVKKLSEVSGMKECSRCAEGD